MGQHTAQVLWHRGDQDFLDKRYSRKHLIRFDGGVEVVGSSSPHVVPLPLSESAAMHSNPARQHGKQLVQPVGHDLDRQRRQDQTHQAGHDVDAGFAQHTRNRLGQ